MQSWRVRLLGGSCAAVVLLASACGGSSRSFANNDPDASISRTDPITGPDSDGGAAAACTKMDILFVIDDSGSMNEEQQGLIQSFPQFVSVLDTYQVAGGGQLDYRVGITTTGRDVIYTLKTKPPLPDFTQDMNQKGMNGMLRKECGMTRRWIERTDANVSSTFACAANVGTSGPGEEMPLLGTELALVERMADGTNAGFIRDDALLALVMITDDEDCSRRDNGFVEYNDVCDIADPNIIPPSHFVEMLDGVKKGRGRWAAAAIAGQTNCTSAFGTANESKRLKQFVGLAGQNAVFASICEGNLAHALEVALGTFKAACTSFTPPK